MDFDELPEEEGLTIAIRGHSKFGKTHMANMIDGPELTVVADTHATNSTVETLRKLGNHKFRRISDWTELLRFTDDFITEYKPPAAFVLDSGSDLVDMAQNYYKKNSGVQAFKFAWAEVWGYIRDWMSELTTRGYDLILTSRMKRVYIASGDDDSGAWNGEWEPKEWKDLDYQLSIGIWLDRGMEIGGRVYFDYRIFPKVSTANGLVMGRWTRLGETKQYITGVFTRENILEQVKTPWYGTIRDILNEYWLQLRESELPIDKKFVADIELFFKGKEIKLDPKWVPPIGEPYTAPQIPIVSVASSRARKELDELEDAVKESGKKEAANGGVNGDISESRTEKSPESKDKEEISDESDDTPDESPKSEDEEEDNVWSI